MSDENWRRFHGGKASREIRKIMDLRDAMRADLEVKKHQLAGFEMAMRIVEQDVEDEEIAKRARGTP